MYGALIASRHNLALTISFLLLGSGFLLDVLSGFLVHPAMMLSESAAAASFGLINSIGQLGGLAGPYMIGFLNDRTHSLTASFGFISLVYCCSSKLDSLLENPRSPSDFARFEIRMKIVA